jgi:hypothetical protein
MQKVLVVGLGGSGGKTLSFLMDEARAQLKDLGWKEKNEDGSVRLPDCWQFVHIDVPANPSLAVAGADLAGTVKGLGGEYIGVYNAGTSYYDIDDKVTEKFQQSGTNGLQRLARWRPAPAIASGISIAGGAGQYRAVGRTLTLSAGDKIYRELRRVVERLMNVKPNDGMALASLQNDDFVPSDPPIIFLVSSMAGGTGSSMILDVSDILNGLTGEFQNFDGDKSAAFLYTADVFKSLPSVYAGAGAQTLATISELLRSRTRIEDDWTEQEWRQLVGNVAITPTATKGRGPAVTIPVGGSVNGRLIGNDTEDIYRGFARVLAPILVDKKIQGSFYSYICVNFPKNAQNGVVETPGFEFMQVLEGQGSRSKTTRPGFFGGFGSANLTTGRDRYAEYSAQRIARYAANVLTEGYSLKNKNAELTTAQQKIDAMATSIYPRFQSVLNLDGNEGSDMKTLQQHIFATHSGTTPLKYSDEKTGAYVSKISGGAAAVVVNALKAYWNEDKKRREDEAKDEARRIVHLWSGELLENLQNAVIMAASEGGIPVAIELLKKSAVDLESFVAKVDVAGKPDTEVQGTISQMTTVKGPLVNSNASKVFSEKVRNFLASNLLTQVNQGIVDVLNELRTSIFRLVENELGALNKQLISELNVAPTVVSPAAFRDAPIDAWPKDDAVPRHFEPAVNEILLSDIETFPADFANDIRKSAPGATNELDEIAKQVISHKLLSVRDGKTVYENVPNWFTKKEQGTNPRVTVTGEWNPAKLIPSQASIPTIKFKLDASSLHDAAVDWIEISGNPFAESCKLSIRAWLDKSPENERLFAGKLADAITYATPLVEIDKAMLNVFHQGVDFAPAYNFSEIPMSPSSSVLTSVIKPILPDGGADNWKRFESVCSPSSSAQSIFISSQLSPYTPWACKSLTEPVRLMSAKGSLEGAWANMRARGLLEFIPIGFDRTVAFLRGWIIGRITGRVILETAASGEITVKVYQPADNQGHPAQWIAFGKEVLGASRIGVAGAQNWNVPAVLLETLPLALSKMNANDQTSWRPYNELIKLGLHIASNPTLERFVSGATELDTWLNGQDKDLGLKTQLAEGVGSELTATQKWLSDVIEVTEQKYQKLVNLTNMDQVAVEVEIAPALIAAGRSVLDELNRPDLGTKKAEFLISESPSALPVLPADTEIREVQG